jgi:hypothetical protein
MTIAAKTAIRAWISRDNTLRSAIALRRGVDRIQPDRRVTQKHPQVTQCDRDYTKKHRHVTKFDRRVTH